MATDKLTSEGAREERRAWMAKIRRMQKQADEARRVAGKTTLVVNPALAELESFGETRRKRYDKAAGGLGRK